MEARTQVAPKAGESRSISPMSERLLLYVRKWSADEPLPIQTPDSTKDAKIAAAKLFCASGADASIAGGCVGQVVVGDPVETKSKGFRAFVTTSQCRHSLRKKMQPDPKEQKERNHDACLMRRRGDCL